jgi:hypothetical protein
MRETPLPVGIHGGIRYRVWVVTQIDRRALKEGVMFRNSHFVPPRIPLCSYGTPLLALTALLLAPAVASAQATQQPQTETRSATVVEVKEQGRSRILVVEDEMGEQHEYPLTARITLRVTAPGDAGFVAEGQYLAGTGVLTNEQIFLTSVEIHLATGRGRPQPGRITKAPAQSGQSQNAYLVAGPIVAAAPDEDYPDHQRVALRVSGPNAPLMLEPDFKVTVVSSDPALITEGATVELELMPLRGGRENLVSATVNLEEAFSSEEMLGTDDE